VRSLLHVDRQHGLALLELGLAFDSRDDEIATARGAYHHVKLRASLGGAGPFPYRYLQTNVTLRAYHPLVPSRRLVLAVRGVADAQVGDVPFYELSRFEEASALGGANGVRGVPGDRYLGKIKLFGNVEARWTAAHVDVAGSRYALGLVGFFDGGRLWADWRHDPTLDGRGLGLKYGAGLGLRVQKGETFVVRADLAWSPDARPVGGYFLAGQLF
jgi:outer membrane protein assembly factor BamA